MSPRRRGSTGSTPSGALPDRIRTRISPSCTVTKRTASQTGITFGTFAPWRNLHLNGIKGRKSEWTFPAFLSRAGRGGGRSSASFAMTQAGQALSGPARTKWMVPQAYKRATPQPPEWAKRDTARYGVIRKQQCPSSIFHRGSSGPPGLRGFFF